MARCICLLRRLTISFAAVFLSTLCSVAVIGQSSDSALQVSNADSRSTYLLQNSTSLSDAMTLVSEEVITQGEDRYEKYSLSAPSRIAPLQANLLIVYGADSYLRKELRNLDTKSPGQESVSVLSETPTTESTSETVADTAATVSVELAPVASEPSSVASTYPELQVQGPAESDRIWPQDQFIIALIGAAAVIIAAIITAWATIRSREGKGE